MTGMSQQEVGQIRTLLDLYYLDIASSDMEAEACEDHLGGMMAHWQLARERSRGTPRVRVYNPNFEEHGWQSRYTIIEVVCDDMPFLVDSMSIALNKAGLTITLTIHPALRSVRDEGGRLREVLPPSDEKGIAESLIRFQVNKIVAGNIIRELEVMIRDVIEDVELATSGWGEMRERIHSIRMRMEQHRPSVEHDDIEESLSFLEWIEDNHFTLLACCDLELIPGESEPSLVIVEESLLGIFRKAGKSINDVESAIPPFCTTETLFTGILLVTKANIRSTVHRPIYMDCIAIKKHDEKGKLTGLYCILGLFTSSAYNSPARYIPLLRKKVADVIQNAGFAPQGHSEKELINVLNTFPRNDLFQISTPELLDISLGILSLQGRQRTRIFVNRDIFNRYYFCLVYLSRERYNRELRVAIEDILVDAFQGTEVEFDAQFSESILARLHFIVHCSPDTRPEFSIRDLENKIVEVVRTWQDEFKDALIEKYDEVHALRYFNEYAQALPASYREDYNPRTAVADITCMEKARAENQIAINFYKPILESRQRVHFRLYSVGHPVPLSEAIPILENMGFTVFGERPYRVRHPSGEIWIHDFSTSYSRGTENLSGETSELVQETFLKVWNKEADNDGFNQLVLAAGLAWRQAMLLRAYSRYLQQIQIPFSQAYIIESLTRNPEIVVLLVDLFIRRFETSYERSDAGDATQTIARNIETALESVVSLDQDRILHAFLNLVQSTLRTNYFQLDIDGTAKSYLSFKIDTRKVSGMPLPMPMFEIFVFSSRMEGVHLRGGPVARGGLRWSDRMEDYRTEILGLMKAQMVKNSVIVPVGSKGGFIVKHLPGEESRVQVMEEIIFCYKTLLRGMLDITDNLVGGKLVPPSQVQRYDGDDPYLVVAADKGTATFSDIANGISGEYGFWLGDAFASGGSAGYDHKKMGITARGAWESVKRNFRELGMDIQTTDFRVIGIGDMSGDVFGNGMLLSRHIKLIGAFDHRHIFLDPDPDPDISFEERKRIFVLQRSSWEDYDKKLISRGGGVFSRGAKSIVISDEVKALLGVKDDTLRPNDLIHQLLKAPVDLLWNGGIGTYVKAQEETNEEVQDKANDALRIDGRELRCKVVGEGGNLGFTQLGRIEFAAKGGLIYTDAIDNSAGVDCSDHEVNIKILLGQILTNGDMTEKQRNRLLEEMTDEVAKLVLQDNYNQTQAVSMVASQAPEKLYEHARFIELLEQKGMLNRQLASLPSNAIIAQRMADNKGLTKPEISVLLSYSKMNYFDALVQSDIPDDNFLVGELIEYFPRVLGEKYRDVMLSHQLRREIISTHITNDIVDHIGPGIGFRVREELGSDIAGVTRGYIAARKIFATDELWRQIEQLDNQVSASVQIDMMTRVSTLLERGLSRILRSRGNKIIIREQVDYFREGVAKLAASIPKSLAAPERLEFKKQVKSLLDSRVPQDLAQRISSLTPMSSAIDIVDVANQAETEISLVASLYFHLGNTLDLHMLRTEISHLGVQTHWHNLAKIKLISMLTDNQMALTAQILKRTGNQKSAKKKYEQWTKENPLTIDRYKQMIAEMKSRTTLDFPILSVAVSIVGDLLAGGGGASTGRGGLPNL